MVKGDRQTVGVLGTFVWDTVDIVGHPIWTGWGGLFYSVAALRAALPDDWVIRPLARVGSDRVSEVRMVLEGWGVDTDGLVADRARNNQVGLTYEYASGHRHTAKNGGVRSWRHDELRHFAEGLDACHCSATPSVTTLDIGSGRGITRWWWRQRRQRASARCPTGPR